LLFGGFPKRRSLLSIFDYGMLEDWGLVDFFRGWIPPAKQRNVISTIADTRRREYDSDYAREDDIEYDIPEPSAPAMDDIVQPLPRRPEEFKSQSDTLTSALEAKGFTAIDVGGGGDCLFRALAHQALGTETAHYDLRQLIAEEIENNRPLYEEDVVALEETETAIPEDIADFKDAVFARYVSKIRTMGRIGDAICIGAFTRLFDCDVVVFLHDRQRGLSSIVFEWPGHGKDERVRRHIAWIPSSSSDEASNHYISVIPSD